MNYPIIPFMGCKMCIRDRIEGDIATIEAAAKREDMHDDRDFIDGTLTSDHMMNSRAA